MIEFINSSILNLQSSIEMGLQSSIFNSRTIPSICASLKWDTEAAPVGQATLQTPHPLHRASITNACLRPRGVSLTLMASKLQASSHYPQARQRLASTRLIIPSATISFLDSTLTARETAPRAWAMLSAANLGPWASPQR